MSLSKYVVHLVNPVSGWVVTQVHAIAATEEQAVNKALASFGVTHADLGQTLRAIPQVIGTVADDEAETAVKAVEAEPVPETKVQVLTEAEQVAARIASSLPADVIAAIAALNQK